MAEEEKTESRLLIQRSPSAYAISTSFSPFSVSYGLFLETSPDTAVLLGHFPRLTETLSAVIWDLSA